MIFYLFLKKNDGRELGIEAQGCLQGAMAVLTTKIENNNITKKLEFSLSFNCAS